MAGPGSVNLGMNSVPKDPSVGVLQGTHEFQTRVNLMNNTTVDVAIGATLEFDNRLGLGDNTLTKTGRYDHRSFRPDRRFGDRGWRSKQPIGHRRPPVPVPAFWQSPAGRSIFRRTPVSTVIRSRS